MGGSGVVFLHGVDIIPHHNVHIITLLIFPINLGIVTDQCNDLGRGMDCILDTLDHLLGFFFGLDLVPRVPHSIIHSVLHLRKLHLT